MTGDEIVRRDAIATLRAREAAGHPLTIRERTLLAHLEARGEIPVGLTIEQTIEDLVGRVYLARPDRRPRPRGNRYKHRQQSLFDAEADAA